MVHKDESEALKVTSAGLKVFERNDKKVKPEHFSEKYSLCLFPEVSRRLPSY